MIYINYFADKNGAELNKKNFPLLFTNGVQTSTTAIKLENNGDIYIDTLLADPQQIRQKLLDFIQHNIETLERKQQQAEQDKIKLEKLKEML